MQRKLYQEMAAIIAARINCIISNNQEWITKHEDRLKELIDLLPHGSGLDGENIINLDKSTSENIVIETSFHHMDENGMYDGWTEHNIIITPSLQHRFYLKITGSNKNDIKTYLSEIFSMALNEVVEV
jgi:hypothetical protein